MTESEIEKKWCVHIVDYFLWTQIIGLDLKNRKKHSSFTLFNLAAKTVTAYLYHKPRLYIQFHDFRYPEWLDEKLNMRCLLLLSSTFRQAVTRQEVHRKIGDRSQFYWKIPDEYDGIGLLVLKKLLAGDRANTAVENQPYVLKFFQWLDVPVICKRSVWKPPTW